MDNNKNIYNTTISNDGIYKIYTLNTPYKNTDNININIIVNFNNIIGGQIN